MRCQFASRYVFAIILTLSAVVWAWGCRENSSIFESKTEGETETETEGEFTLLTYNVAGLPQGISASNPEVNIPLISPLLNNYNIALVQEDFFYHEQLTAATDHPHKSTPKAEKEEIRSSDGLNRFSLFGFTKFIREAWITCSDVNSNDCLARKGFSVAKTEIVAGVVIDIYNLHMDAGSTDSDKVARHEQVQQLLQTIKTRSDGKAIIVAGDTNLDILRRAKDDTTLQILLQEAGLTEACEATECGRHSIDRVLFRGSSGLQLRVLSWQTDDDFVDGNGNGLSDHKAVGVRFAWVLL